MSTRTVSAGHSRRPGELVSFSLRLGAETLALRGSVPVLLRCMPLDRVLRTLSVEGKLREDPRELLAAVERVTDFVTRRLRPTRTACLERALVRYALLRRHGLRPRFVIGVRPGGERGFEAHAWLTLDGSPLMEREPLACRSTFEWPRAVPAD